MSIMSDAPLLALPGGSILHLEVYLLWFVRRRRALSKKYEKEAITVLGNVEYNEQYVKSKILGPIAQMLRSTKNDLEADWASFSGGVGLPVDDDQIEVIQDGFFQAPQVMSRNRSLGVLLVSTAWILFTFFASLFVVQQIDRIDSFYQDENARLAWIIFWSVIGGVVPVVAFGGNFLRWKMYQRWVLHAGKKSKNTCARDDEEGGGYVQMS
ncbi:hypothetical protein THAOC_27319 [Thalassiosira oceanica]|uniref:Uncharacterized protein n=1 Tax=Thalassiosira oceanica TaxID=159749 RepID=K0RJ78_THAOC|nr:hypothetical protein THAOC_27319 [Thalassiosira oceanica]|eukprot:EJK53275.1 hypothetical protein THAOC_27319 [Thalassiosira oceanica]